MKKLIPFFFVSLLLSCTSGTAEKESESTKSLNERPADWQGMWSAQWDTPPESYPGIENMTFTMNGKFIFANDSLTVEANGYDGCIFNSDTLSHTQSWYVRNDTLFLLNEPELPGMTYLIKSKNENKVELQLMEDIFVTLTK